MKSPVDDKDRKQKLTQMKKIFTLIAATFLTVATFAADHRPSVSIRSRGNYEVVIDGRSYISRNGMMDLSNLRKGQHSIKVYELSRTFMFMKTKRLVDASFFQLRNRDLDIYVDFRGQIRISEDRRDRDRWDNDRDWNNGRDRDYGHDRDFGQDRRYDDKDWNNKR